MTSAPCPAEQQACAVRKGGGAAGFGIAGSRGKPLWKLDAGRVHAVTGKSPGRVM